MMPPTTPDLPADLAHLSPTVSERQLSDLHARFARDAQQRGLLDVAYRTLDSAVGPLLLAATERGVVRVAFASEGFDGVLSDLADRVSARVLAAPSRLDATASQLEEYFAGRRRRFDVPLDLSLATGFRRRVLEQLPMIDYGRTASYAEVARAAGSERAMRAVGSACATNPVPLLVPCHRVVRSDGALGGYRGGLPAKKALLALERT
ncbi:methylated-DNA--[protein]-cysteine S-methyltransferase [Ruania halotolerans]|uniref:methylated-DNA--[protein]-cysteine S-methyltransferase n=1 Tax=Ruania halotolerans TaxID=2897773 RepID=UPI001E44E2E8|nr:methylated-DNA--[protein]-cysteine S-methyltransferase [Ruania halotolerans]UFU06389.1 methylated-DNA--[protein]-cysteine S-methyltransferase [Ruania halotolerans]